MAVDKLVDSGKLDACCEAEAAAIIAKGGGTAPLAYDFANNKGFADAIAAIPSGGITPTGKITITENGTDIDVAQYALADVNVQSGGSLPLQLELIGMETVELEETTSTTAETISTNINISNTDYIFGIITIECDGVADGAKDWGGLSFASFWRSKTSGNLLSNDSATQYNIQGMNTLSYIEYKASTSGGNMYSNNFGVYITSSVANVTFNRKCHTSNCPKIMGGTYTVRAYGVVGV